MDQLSIQEGPQELKSKKIYQSGKKDVLINVIFNFMKNITSFSS